jgi:hypothetical protein
MVYLVVLEVIFLKRMRGRNVSAIRAAVRATSTVVVGRLFVANTQYYIMARDRIDVVRRVDDFPRSKLDPIRSLSPPARLLLTRIWPTQGLLEGGLCLSGCHRVPGK